MIYVMPAGALRDSDHDDIQLLELWRIVWHGKWLIVAITAVFAALSVVVALAATEWYRSEITVAPAGQRSTSGFLGQLAGSSDLARLAGVSVGGDDSIEPLAILRSRQFTGAFIEEKGLLTVLFADDWDEENGRWKIEDPKDQPDIQAAVKYFNERLRTISEDERTGLVTVSVEWTDPELAAEWANSLVTRLNEHMRQRALKEAETNVAYLEEQLTNTNVATLRQTIGRLLETELQELMLARGSEEFAFRVIDAAEVQKYRSRPKRALMVILATLAGGFVSVLFIFIRHAFRKMEESSRDVS
jgi:uncharacterized protein involved in exopolysaccharide biosynthesis